MQFYYPSLPYQPRTIDPLWEPEYAWATTQGLAVGLVDVSSEKVLPKPAATPVIYRGWMLSTPDYATLSSLLPLAVPTAAYLASHEASGWYEAIVAYTFPSRFLTQPVPLGLAAGRRFFVKGLVKSFGCGSVVTSQAELDGFWQRHELPAATPLFMRDFVELKPNSERRFFVVRGQAYGAENAALPGALQAVLPLLAPRLFYSLDVTETLAGQPVVVEVGDGQVSDLKEWTVADFGSQVLRALAGTA